MRKGLWLISALIALSVVLSACGTKSQEDVTKGLKEKVGNLKGYKATAQMTLTVGNDPQSYDIDVWHNKPGDYRVHLKNEKKDQSQMILRNKSGVYVVTPALNKSYRFQSEWPQNSSQAYLYESLVADVLNDKEAKFKATDDHYVFETKTRYQNNKMLPSQEITFRKDTLEPVTVKVMDTNHNPVMTVEFSKVDFNAKFDKDAFETEKNMTSAQMEVPVLANSNKGDFTVKYVMADIPNVSLADEKEMETDNGKRIILTYGGDKSFTLFQEQARVVPATSMKMIEVEDGEMVDLGASVGVMTEQSVTWSENGVDYMLVSNDLTPDEMVMAAKSVQAGTEK
ncbi:outer membrane lipoprotein carrier protein LolA [Bacillus sp. FJAT-50079]|uniref:LolA family protein n=1 Tax=Bacillus sp. FJAT-50079 TaxID=2833577 RepID=UPI001BC929BD|nr:outer membrane lipoprotein carrier protein LolA [Bacillus sp. FJAT-50079]MBS4206477.1 outer membrane lipoprotein carrier protein LolA [Bacillus sp. FJAT-50079]